MNVLLSEDDPELSAIACAQLENRGHTAIPAYTLAQGRDILKADDPSVDILVADHEIPDGFGVRFAIETKGMPRKIKVVVVSGKLSMSDIEELEAHGIAYFNKLLRYSEIVDELIRQHF